MISDLDGPDILNIGNERTCFARPHFKVPG